MIDKESICFSCVSRGGRGCACGVAHLIIDRRFDLQQGGPGISQP